MSKFKMRRSCITAVLALATTSALHVVAKAQPSMAMGGDGKGQPYTPPMPYREVAEVEADQRVVHIFFSFSCPFCRTFHTPLRQWAKSLPAPWRYEFVPILLADGTGIHEAAGYLAAQKALGSAVARFEDAAYRAIQGEGRSPRAPETWRGIVNAAGGSVLAFEEAWESLSPAEVAELPRSMIAYAVDATPTVAIAGKFVLTPDGVQGDEALFLQLCSGLVSRAMGHA